MPLREFKCPCKRVTELLLTGRADEVTHSIECDCGQTAHRIPFSKISSRRAFDAASDGAYDGPRNLKLGKDGQVKYATSSGDIKTFDPK